MKSVRTYTLLAFFLIPVITVAQTRSIIYDGLTGIEHIHMHNDTAIIVEVFKKTPAWEAGIEYDDKLISIDGITVSGTGCSLRDIKDLLLQKDGTKVTVTISRESVDSLMTFRFSRISSMSTWIFLDYEYLVDSSRSLDIDKILTDSVQALFSDPLPKKLMIKSVEEGSTADLAGIKAGDRLISLEEGLDNHNYLSVEYVYDLEDLKYLTGDTLLRIQRKEKILEFEIDKHGRSVVDGITTQFHYDKMQKCVWLKFITEPRLNRSGEYLVNMWVSPDTLTSFQLDYNGDALISIAGIDIPREWKDFIYKDWAAVPISVNKYRQQEFYLRLSSGESLEEFEVPMVSKDAVTRYDRMERVAFSLLFGMMLVIFFYYLVLFISNRKRSYLYYSLFILSYCLMVLATEGYVSEYTGSWFEEAKNYLLELINALPFVFLLLFGLNYLEAHHRGNIWYRLIIWNIVIIGVSTSYLVISYLISIDLYSGDFSSVIFYIYMISTLFSSLLILTVLSIIRIRNGFRPAWYFLFATLVFAGFLIYGEAANSAFSIHALISSNFNTIIANAATLIGTVLQFLVFSIGLGQKMKLDELEKKRAQEKIISQLKENEKLKDKVNRELEQKVQERTQEVVQQKEEIEAQRDEIEAQRDLVVKQKDIVTSQKQELTDSIEYAQRIQSAVLPHKSYMDKVMPEYFVLFKPRDIVSGDFYWIREVKSYLVLVAADCTGHGVPGAFMSMLGIAMLNEIVGKSRFDAPGEILNRLRKKVKDTLVQEGKMEEQKDGMDMALVILNRENLELQYAGAFNPLYLLRENLKPGKKALDLPGLENKAHRLFELKADRQPIAIYQEETDFTTQTLQLEKGDSIYLFSDGFVDQIGGPKAKKFLSKNFKRYLLEIQGLDMAAQNKHMEETLEEWMKGFEQRDDILVMGLRV